MRGTCIDYCPKSEQKLRIKERLLHFFELKDGKKEPGTLVKCFSRSAAGVATMKKTDLRTEQALHETIEYLFKYILEDKRRSYSFVYDFIFDRLWAVRQEIVIQEFDAKQSIALLQPMILFLAYSRFNLCEEPIETFDPAICEKHLQECLKRVLCCYDEVGVGNLNFKEMQQCVFMECIYQIFNLGSIHTLNRAISGPELIRKNTLFILCFNMSLNYFNGQLLRVLRAVPLLPHILCGLANLKLPQIRYKLLHMFVHAYNSKVLTVPLEFLSRCMQHANKRQTIAECKFYGLAVQNQAEVMMNKNSFEKDKIIALKKEHKAVEKLTAVNLPDLLLLRETESLDDLQKIFDELKF